jgi:tRNA-Thr(GGU) m(6)t(6)A37 methyltransferase TsaA
MTTRASPAQSESIPTREVDAILERGIHLVRARSEVVLNAVDDGIYVLDHLGYTIFANEAAVRMLGYTLREMLGRPQHALIHHTHADGSEFPVEDCPIYQAAHFGVYQRVGGDAFWKKDGRPLSVDYTSTPIKEGRAVVGAVITFRESSQEGAPEAASLTARQPESSGSRQPRMEPLRPVLEPIGYVRSTLTSRADAPKQGDEGAPDAWLLLDTAYADEANDLEPGDELIVLTWLDRGDRTVQAVHPRDDESMPLRGVFSTRSSDRPNPIGLHRVLLIEAPEPMRLRVTPLEAIDGTPIVDIKPVLDSDPER